MTIFRGSWSSYTDTAPSVVTVGSFDGLHLGHREVIQTAINDATASGQRSVVLTFDTHPRNVVGDIARPIPLLTTLDEKLELLGTTGVDHVMVIHFDHTVVNMSPEEFVRIILTGRIGMKRMVVGYNHGFGKGRSGDRESLFALSRAMNFSVNVVNPVRVGEAIISSTGIRTSIAEGKMDDATAALGQYYSVKGTVIRGFGRGRRLGCPTANLGLIQSNKMSPRDGIYSGFATWEGGTWPAAISIGFNPTFEEHKHSIEAHLIGFDGDLYDRELKVEFVERIRGEVKCSGETELAARIQDDIRDIMERLGTRGLLSDVLTAKQN